MGPRSDRERVKQIAGWTFVQWAHAAAFMALRSPGAPPPPITLAGLMAVQRFWLERHRDVVPARYGSRYGFMERPSYRWGWTCGAFASAVDELFPELRRAD